MSSNLGFGLGQEMEVAATGVHGAGLPWFYGWVRSGRLVGGGQGDEGQQDSIPQGLELAVAQRCTLVPSVH